MSSPVASITTWIFLIWCRLSEELHQCSLNQRLNSQTDSWISSEGGQWLRMTACSSLSVWRVPAPPTPPHSPILACGVAVVPHMFWQGRLETATGLTVQHFSIEKICLLAVTISPHLMSVWTHPLSHQRQLHPLRSAADNCPYIHLPLDLLDFFHLPRLFETFPSSPLPLEFINRLSAPTSHRQTYVSHPRLAPLGLFISKGWLLTQQPAASPHLCWRRWGWRGKEYLGPDLLMLFPFWLFSSVFTVFPASVSEQKPLIWDVVTLHCRIFPGFPFHDPMCRHEEVFVTNSSLRCAVSCSDFEHFRFPGSWRWARSNLR